MTPSELLEISNYILKWLTVGWASFKPRFLCYYMHYKRQSYIDEKFNQEMTFRVKEGKHIQQ